MLTTTWTVPAPDTSEAVRATWSWLALIRVAAFCMPPQVTVLVLVYPLPFTDTVTGDPNEVEGGDRLVKAGTGLFTVKPRVFWLTVPRATLLTPTRCWPGWARLAAGIVAWSEPGVK